MLNKCNFVISYVAILSSVCQAHKDLTTGSAQLLKNTSTQESKAALASVDKEESRRSTGIWNLLQDWNPPVLRSDASWQELLRMLGCSLEPLLHQRWVFPYVDNMMNNYIYKQEHRAWEHCRHGPAT